MSPKTGVRIASEAVWLKMVPRAIADGFTGGRSMMLLDKIVLKPMIDSGQKLRPTSKQ